MVRKRSTLSQSELTSDYFLRNINRTTFEKTEWTWGQKQKFGLEIRILLSSVSRNFFRHFRGDASKTRNQTVLYFEPPTSDTQINNSNPIPKHTFSRCRSDRSARYFFDKPSICFVNVSLTFSTRTSAFVQRIFSAWDSLCSLSKFILTSCN